MTVISLTTDFGSGDHEAGVLKGVIWNISPDANIVDLSHDVSPHDVFEAGLILWRAAPYFPEGSVHVAVVDPGVGTSRRSIAARVGSQYFVGPDNGTITFLLEWAEERKQVIRIVKLDKPAFWLPEVSNVFHGRDVFAPVAAHLSAGIPLHTLGTPVLDPVRLTIPVAVQSSRGWVGQVIHIDHFGNLSTNLQKRHISPSKEAKILVKDRSLTSLVSTFGEASPGELVALLDSSDRLAISMVNGNAAQLLKVDVGEPIELIIPG